MWYWLPVFSGVITSISLILVETKRVKDKGKPLLEKWAEKNGYQGINCYFHDCNYRIGARWWQIVLSLSYGISVTERSGKYRLGYAVCDLSAGEVSVKWDGDWIQGS